MRVNLGQEDSGTFASRAHNSMSTYTKSRWGRESMNYSNVGSGRFTSADEEVKMYKLVRWTDVE